MDRDMFNDQILRFNNRSAAGLSAVVFILGCVFLPLSGADQKQLIAEEIIKKADEAVFFAGKDATCTLRIEERDDEIPEGSLKLRILRLNDAQDGSQKFYVYFLKPDMVSGIRYLVWKYPNQEDQRWIYMPLLDFVQKVPAESKRSQFLKLHFTYEDVTGRKLDEDHYELMDSSGTGHYRIKSWPKKDSNAEFAYYYIWIRQKDFLPVKIEFLDKDDNLIRLIEALETKIIEGHPTITKALIKDVSGFGEATLFFENVHYNVGLTDDLFSESSLRNIPDHWIYGEEYL